MDLTVTEILPDEEADSGELQPDILGQVEDLPLDEEIALDLSTVVEVPEEEEDEDFVTGNEAKIDSDLDGPSAVAAIENQAGLLPDCVDTNVSSSLSPVENTDLVLSPADDENDSLLQTGARDPSLTSPLAVEISTEVAVHAANDLLSLVIDKDVGPAPTGSHEVEHNLDITPNPVDGASVSTSPALPSRHVTTEVTQEESHSFSSMIITEVPSSLEPQEGLGHTESSPSSVRDELPVQIECAEPVTQPEGTDVEQLMSTTDGNRMTPDSSREKETGGSDKAPSSQMSDITNQTVSGDSSKEQRSKKKRKKKKTDKSADKQEISRSHIQGGFSSGWVGPMLQLVTSMKRIDDFKSRHADKYMLMTKQTRDATSPDTTKEGTPANKPITMSEALIQAPPGEGCPRCGGAVFEAEKMQSRFRNYHRKCFNCKECNGTLDSTKACDGPDKDVYCKLCYSKKYGPKGYGFGCGAAFLQSDAIRDEVAESRASWSPASTTSIKASPGHGCPRCGGAVFAAELMLSKGKEWHRSCFTCRDCKRPLDSTSACDGADRELYCKQDYARRFGPKGFGYGHAPTLVSGSVEEQLPNNGMVLQPSMGAKAPPGEGCPRCGFFVYAAEKMPVKNRTYHKKCFNCNKCHKSLDSTNACDSPDQEIYCRTCYARLFGPRGVGYGLGAGVLSMG